VRVSILQPTYWARAHVWNRVLNSDVYVWLDSVQFARSKTKWEDRTIVEEPNGRPLVLRLPLSGSKRVGWLDAGLNEGWERHARSLRHCYPRAPHWPTVEALLPPVYERPADTIEQVCWRTFIAVSSVLEPTCSVVRSSELGIRSRRGDLMYDLVKAVGGTEYLTGGPGADYLPLDRFSDGGVSIAVQDWSAPETAAGLKNPSVIHLLAHEGPARTRDILATAATPAPAP
jgi:hypothetical protein